MRTRVRWVTRWSRIGQISIALGALALLAPVVSRTQTRDNGTPTKIGVVDLERAVEGSPDFPTAGETWTVEMNRWSAEIAAKQEEVRTAQEQLVNQQNALSETARGNLVRSIEELETEVDRLAEDGQITLNGLREQLLIPITQQVDQLVLDYALENGFDLVLDVSNPNTAVIFSDEVIDITDEVIQHMQAAPPPANVESGPDQQQPNL